MLADYLDEIANRYSLLQATESCAGPGNEASTEGWDNVKIHIEQLLTKLDSAMSISVCNTT